MCLAKFLIEVVTVLLTIIVLSVSSSAPLLEPVYIQLSGPDNEQPKFQNIATTTTETDSSSTTRDSFSQIEENSILTENVENQTNKHNVHNEGIDALAQSSNFGTELVKKQTDLDNSQSRIFSAISNFPFATSVGAALLLGGITYYVYPSSSNFAERTVQVDDDLSDKGVRIVRPSELTIRERERLINAASYVTYQRSFPDQTAKPVHPYVELAKRMYNYIMSDFITTEGTSVIDREFEEPSPITSPATTTKASVIKKTKKRVHPYQNLGKNPSN